MFRKTFAMKSANVFNKITEGYNVSCVKLLMFWYITRRSIFIWNIVQLIIGENWLLCSKKLMFLKTCVMESTSSLSEWRSSSDVLCKNIFVTDLLGSQHLFEILLTSHTFKNCENVEKSGCFENLLRRRAPFFLRNEWRM